MAEEKKSYVPLHVHTEYSLLDGAIKLKDYIAFAKEQGWPALSITDHGNVFGAVKFFQQAKKAGIKPILGMEAYFTPDAKSKNSVEKKYYHTTLIVQNAKGYQTLCRLISYSFTEGFYFKPRIDFNALQNDHEGIFVSGGCMGGLIPVLLREGKEDEAKEALDKFISIVGKENFYLEISPADFEEGVLSKKLVIDFANKHDVMLVATPDSHYLKPSDKSAHEVMLCIGTKNLITDSDRFTFKDFIVHLKTTQEMLDAFPGNEEAVYNSGKVADRCSFEFEFGKLMFPSYQVPEEYTQESYFRHLCNQGLDSIFGKGLVAEQDKQTYTDRLNLEMDLIAKMGFVGYFLVVGDFIAWGKENHIPIGPGRGSGAGSLVAWALQITNVDPLKYNLLFERFLNPERVSMPDFDIDFCILGREEVINYVKQKYGQDCVCQIITFGTMAAKGVLKDVARVLGLSFAESQAITDLVPEQLKITLKEAIEQEPLLQQMIDTNPKVREVFEISKVLEGVTRHASKHAAGVVISPQPLKDVIPLYIPSKTTDLVTQYAMSELEAVGFLKMDFLGLKNLTVIDRTVKSVKKNFGVDIDLDTLSVDDRETYKTLSAGKTAGVFQFEGSGVTEVLLKLKPEKFEDLIAVNALYRPGPLGSGMVDDFIAGRHGTKEPTYLFEELRPILQETYGVIVYQEQVMKVASAIAGYSLGGADLLRRAMGKKKPEEMAKQKSIFLEGSQKLGFDQVKSERLFDLMAYFAGYGFNKSHSAAYALIAYQTAYLKTHYPKEFVAAMLSFETSDPDKLREYLQKAKEVDVKVFPPDINKSEVEFSADKDGVLFGLSGIKNVGQAVISEILEKRKDGPFVSFLDFCRRISLRTANKRVLESLIYSGAMDCLPGNRSQKIAKIEEVISLVNKEKELALTGQTSLFGSFSTETSTSATQELAYDLSLQEMSLSDKLDKEREVLGLYLSSHPLQQYDFLKEAIQKTPFHLPSLKDENPASYQGKKVMVLAILSSAKIINTKAGKKMAFLAIEDICGNNLEAIIFPGVFEKIDLSLLEEGSALVFIGTFELAGELNKLKCEKIFAPTDMEGFKACNMFLEVCLPSTLSDHFVEQIQNSIDSGSGSLILSLRENEALVSILLSNTKLNFSKIYQLDSKVELKLNLYN